MSKEEPAWKAELEKDLALALSASGIHSIHDRVMARDAILPAAWAAILAAEQRGFQAGVNKTGDSVGKLREQLKTMEARLDAVRKIHANDEWHCGTCADEFSSAAPWPCPTAAALAPDKP